MYVQNGVCNNIRDHLSIQVNCLSKTSTSQWNAQVYFLTNQCDHQKSALFMTGYSSKCIGFNGISLQVDCTAVANSSSTMLKSYPGIGTSIHPITSTSLATVVFLVIIMMISIL